MLLFLGNVGLFLFGSTSFYYYYFLQVAWLVLSRELVDGTCKLILYILSLWMQNYSCPDKKRWIGRWSMGTMATFHSSQSSTCLGMKPECLKSAPSPLSSLDTEVKSKLAIGSFLFYFSFLGIWLILGFWFLNCLLQRSTC